MRSAPLLTGLVLTALVGLAAAAPADPYVAMVQVETDVRSGHGDGSMFYATNHLNVGDRVNVQQDMGDGWLAILPPSGSFSWVNKGLLKIDASKSPPIFMVDAPEAAVRIGSNVWNGPPTIIGPTKKRGQILTAHPVMQDATDSEGTWTPIEPPPGEVRYIRAAAVQKPAASANVVTLPAGGPAPGQDADSLYKRAIEAEQWNPQEAITLYNQGATADTNADRRLQALNRANWLRDNLRNPSPTLIAGPPPGAEVQTANTPAVSKVYPLPPDPSAVTPAVRLSPPQGVVAGVMATPAVTTNSVSAAPTASWSSAPSPALAPAAPANGNVYPSGAGWLQPSHRQPPEGGKMYVLVSDRGVPFYHVTAEPGVNLEPYLTHRVECFGQAIYSGELRSNYMRVARVEMRQGQ